jgi:PAS domain S-box-containing protein
VQYTPWDKWFTVRHYPMPNGGVATFFQDITERKLTESQLQEQRERFAFATHASQIGYWFCDLPFDKLIWDARVKKHFWLPPDADVDIELFYERLHPDDRERTRKAIEGSIANHTRYDIEYRTVSPGGEQKWIRAIGRTAYDETGRPLRFDGVTQDTTALKRALEALDDERRRLSAVFENVPVGLVFIEAGGRIVSGNPRAESILGHPMRLAGNPESYRDWVVFHPDGRVLDGADHPLALALADGDIHRGEYLFQLDNGEKTWVEFTGAPIRDSRGAIIGAVAAIAHIDGRKRAEEALIRSEKLAVVGRLAATISHEINNPLEAVTNLLYLIHENTSDLNARAHSKTAQEELARVSHIVTHTLRFNRQTNGGLHEKISDLLDSALAIYEARLKNAGIALRRDYVDTKRVFCFGSEMRQVFANLIGNAFDATKRGGALVIRTRDQRNWRTGECGVRVTIGDSGHGMDDETRRHLFEPFFTTKGDNGTGLGLWVSREILNKHRAIVRIKSKQGPVESGTTFSIWLSLNALNEKGSEKANRWSSGDASASRSTGA